MAQVRVPNVPTSRPCPHHLPRSLPGCQQSATEEAPGGLGGSPSRSDASASRSWTSVSLPQKAYPAASPANSRGSLGTNWFLSLCLRLCTELTYARLRSASSSRSTLLILAQAGVEPRSARINGGPCTTCPRSGENTSDPILCSLIRGRQQLALSLPWEPFFSFAFKAHKHINLLEIESAFSLLRHLASEGRRNCRILALTDSRVALGTLSKGRSSSRRLNFLLKKVAALCLCYGFQFDVVWCPTWRKPADAPSREQPLFACRSAPPELLQVPPARLLSQQAENQLRQLARAFLWSLQGEPGCPSSSPACPSAAPRRSPLPPQSGQSLAMLLHLASDVISGKRSQFPCLFFQRAASARAQCCAWRRLPIASNRCRRDVIVTRGPERH